MYMYVRLKYCVSRLALLLTHSIVMVDGLSCSINAELELLVYTVSVRMMII